MRTLIENGTLVSGTGEPAAGITAVIIRTGSVHS